MSVDRTAFVANVVIRRKAKAVAVTPPKTAYLLPDHRCANFGQVTAGTREDEAAYGLRVLKIGR